MSLILNKGDEVAIINRTAGGKLVVEGRATLIRETEVADRWLVKFVGGCFADSEVPVERFVAAAAQADPEGYVRAINLGGPTLHRQATLGNYSRAHDTASYLDAFNRGLEPVVEKLETAKAELESCGASKTIQYEFELAVAAMTDALAAIATEADSCR